MRMNRQSFFITVLIFLIAVLASCSGDENAAVEVDNANNNDESNDNEEKDDEMSPFIERGEALMDGSEELVEGEEGNELSCMSCHAGDSDSNGESLVGITKEYPKYDERKDAVITLEEKINDSIVHDLNGEKIDYDGEEMRSIVAYLTDISKGEDYEAHKDEDTIEEIADVDLEKGEKIFNEKIKDSAPVLFGESSFADSSSMSRMLVMTNYVKNNLPQDDPDSLSDQEASDVAAYILSEDRPKWIDEDSADWTEENKPADFINAEERDSIQSGDFDWSTVNDN